VGRPALLDSPPDLIRFVGPPALRDFPSDLILSVGPPALRDFPSDLILSVGHKPEVRGLKDLKRGAIPPKKAGGQKTFLRSVLIFRKDEYHAFESQIGSHIR
jgi:hypothetical protein